MEYIQKLLVTVVDPPDTLHSEYIREILPAQIHHHYAITSN